MSPPTYETLNGIQNLDDFLFFASGLEAAKLEVAQSF